MEFAFKNGIAFPKNSGFLGYAVVKMPSLTLLIELHHKTLVIVLMGKPSSNQFRASEVVLMKNSKVFSGLLIFYTK